MRILSLALLPVVEKLAGSALLLDRAQLAPGMRVLDVGCGPGRLTIPAARRVGPHGQVVAIDAQPQMIHKVEQRVREARLSNVRTVVGDISVAQPERGSFDRALLVTVLGEIPDREAALEQIYDALAPGGLLSITEVFLDPDYQRRATVEKLCDDTGFELDAYFGNWRAFTLNVRKPLLVA